MELRSTAFSPEFRHFGTRREIGQLLAESIQVPIPRQVRPPPLLPLGDERPDIGKKQAGAPKGAVSSHSCPLPTMLTQSHLRRTPSADHPPVHVDPLQRDFRISILAPKRARHPRQLSWQPDLPDQSLGPDPAMTRLQGSRGLGCGFCWPAPRQRYSLTLTIALPPGRVPIRSRINTLH